MQSYPSLVRDGKIITESTGKRYSRLSINFTMILTNELPVLSHHINISPRCRKSLPRLIVKQIDKQRNSKVRFRLRFKMKYLRAINLMLYILSLDDISHLLAGQIGLLKLRE